MAASLGILLSVGSFARLFVRKVKKVCEDEANFGVTWQLATNSVTHFFVFREGEPHKQRRHAHKPHVGVRGSQGEVIWDDYGFVADRKTRKASWCVDVC